MLRMKFFFVRFCTLLMLFSFSCVAFCLFGLDFQCFSVNFVVFFSFSSFIFFVRFSSLIPRDTDEIDLLVYSASLLFWTIFLLFFTFSLYFWNINEFGLQLGPIMVAKSNILLQRWRSHENVPKFKILFFFHGKLKMLLSLTSIIFFVYFVEWEFLK